MTGNDFQFACLDNPRMAEHALTASPAWLWSMDATRILWANPSGAAVFDAASPGAVAGLSFEPTHPAAAQVARLAATLPQGGAARLERLRGFGASLGGTLICLCTRIVLADNAHAILIVATERAGKELPLPERAERLLAGLARPAAVFTADGEPIAATADAQKRFGAARDLVALGATALAREATLNGKAEGTLAGCPVALWKLGAGRNTMALLAAFDSSADAPALPQPEAAPAPAPLSAASADTREQPRRLPFRFVWQLDAGGRFTQGADDLVRLFGPRTAALIDRPWNELAAGLDLDPNGKVAAAPSARETWSGIQLDWPVDETGERLRIELSGLPIFDRDRQFAGFRGFGICREVERLDALERRRMQPPAAPAPPKPQPVAAPAPAPKVVPFPTPSLSAGEHSAFQELARELGERLKKKEQLAARRAQSAPAPDDFGPEPVSPAPPPPEPRPARQSGPARDAHEGRPILDKLPTGILVYRLNNLIYANRAFLDWTGYETLDALAEAGGLDSLFIETADAQPAPDGTRNGAKSLTIATVNGNQRPVEGRLFSVAWNNENALVLMINTQRPPVSPADQATEASLRRAEIEMRELESILDTATDGVLVLDRTGRVLSANQSAQALFGYDEKGLAELSLGDLMAPESRPAVLEHLDRLARNGTPQSFDAGREAIGLVRQGGLVPLFITVGRIENGEKFCAVLRDITAWKRTEEELINARQEAEKASTAKSEFLAKVSHEIRTPLNAIIGFSEVMMDERFGPIGNERYRQYLKDIHASGGHLIALINDLIDLSKIETGKLELSFVSVNLNDIVQQCVALMQEQANHDRIIIRTSLSSNLPPVVADARSLRQIAFNLLSNSIKYTGAGGQVIVSTALTDDHEVVLRVRDTGQGMNEKELKIALEPFRQIATTTHWGAGGSGLGLPITKALAEANHAHFRITSDVESGTLVEVAFPATRMAAK